MMKRIYLDHAATTQLDPAVKKAMEPFWSVDFGNASSIYEEGRVAKKAISDARHKVSEILSARPDEIIFTSSGTESDNLAIFGSVGTERDQISLRTSHNKRAKSNFPHIITSSIEHHAVLHACEKLEKEGFEVSYLDVDKDGLVDLEELKKELRKETILVSIMYANNEIGTIQPISRIAKIIRAHRKEHGVETPYFHTDAIQTPSFLDLNVAKLGIDLMSLNGSKIYGPKGVGCLYKKRGLKIEPILYGGGQESGLRPGTENIPAIVGFAEALEVAQKEREKESARLIELRNYFIENLSKTFPDSKINGSLDARLPNNINISFHGVEGESIILYLDAKGIASSTGSACSSDSLEPSHVIKAIGRCHEHVHGSVRFSLGKENTKEDIDYVLKVLPDIINKLKNISSIK
ncbi:cysteine desulfurase family protein [Patescibacteria group bacterium]